MEPESEHSYEVRGIELPVPTSFVNLPRLSRPNAQQIDAVAELEKRLVRESGIEPGTYSAFDGVTKLIAAHDRMWDALESKLSEFNQLAACKYLYRRLETIIGHLHRSQYQMSTDQFLTGNTHGAAQRVDTWLAITPMTEGIKFLLEMAIRHSKPYGRVSEGAWLDYLIELSSRIVMMDAHLESIHARVVPYEIVVGQDFTVHGGITEKARGAIDVFKRSRTTHQVQANRDFIDMLKHSQEKVVSVEDFKSFPELATLHEAMTQELGYGVFDWLEYNKGCADLFNEDDFLKVIGVPRLTRHLRNKVGLHPEVIEALLQDHSISFDTVKDLSRDAMMPMTKYRRDSRLLRRPILQVQDGDAKIALMGIETLLIAFRVVFDSLQYGTIRIPRIRKHGPVKAALGTLQSQIGSPLRDSICSKCNEMGLAAKTEWPIPRMNSGDQRIGPVDVLVVDNRARRFILVEAKNLQSPGIVPNEMKEQRDRFLGAEGEDDESFIQTLNKKVHNFESNKRWHIERLGLESISDFSIHGVVVTNHPLLWPLFASKPLPILDDLEFYKRVQSGQGLLSTPAAV